jgi:uncharacterized coiled-coil protein SlyX
MTDDDRLMAAETALAHAEQAIDDLSQVVQAQAGEINALRRDLGRLEAVLARLMDGDDESDLCVS